MDMMHHHSHEHGVYKFHAYWKELLVKFIYDYLDMLWLFGYVVSVWCYRIKVLETTDNDLIERKVWIKLKQLKVQGLIG